MHRHLDSLVSRSLACLLLGAAVLAHGATAAEDRQVAALRARVASLAAEAQRLEDANSVRNLQRAYGYYLNKGYWQEAADLFADNATYEVGVDGVYVGKAHILARIVAEGGGNPGPGLPYGQLNTRMQLQPVVDIASDGRTARARWRELALQGQFQKWAGWGDGVYENEYVKEGGVWKISRLHYFPSFLAPYKGGWAILQPVTGDWKSETAKRLPADLPPTVVYKPFPDVYTPPFHYKNPVSGE